MKCVIFCVLMFYSALGYGNQREIRVDGNRRIFIQDSRKMVIFNVRNDEPKVIEIITKDNDRLMKIIKINDDKEIIKEITLVPGSAMVGLAPGSGKTDTGNNREARTDINRQMTILTNIFKKYEGFVGEENFYRLLKEIKQSVQRQELHPVIYDVVQEFEINPNGNVKRTDEDLKDVRTEPYGEAAKLQMPGRDENRQTSEKMKLNEVLQATRQIQWIQSLLANKRKQQLGDRQGDLPILRSSRDRIEQNSLNETLLQIAIQELQREIIQQQKESQQLQIQQQFLIEQKEQLKRVKDNQNRNRSQMQEKAYDQVKERIEQLVDEQLRIEKTVSKLQESLIKEIEDLKNILRKDSIRD